MNTITRFVISIILLAGAVAVFLFVTQQHNSPTNKLTVTATYYPLYEFSKQIGGDKVTVQNITPAGSEPHDFEPSPRQLVTAQQSDVFVYNGAGLEPWVKKFLKSDYENIAVRASKDISLISSADYGKESEENTSQHHESEGADPHFWLDPVYAQQIIDNIADGFSKARPQDTSYFAARAAIYKEKLANLDRSYKNGLATCSSRKVVTSHNAFRYLAKRYNLDITPISGVSPDEEPSAAKLGEIVTLVKEKKIQYIFFESLVSSRLADTIAKETGAKTAVFDPIEGISHDEQTKGADYISIQQENLKNLRTALACR